MIKFNEPESKKKLAFKIAVWMDAESRRKRIEGHDNNNSNRRNIKGVIDTQQKFYSFCLNKPGEKNIMIAAKIEHVDKLCGGWKSLQGVTGAACKEEIQNTLINFDGGWKTIVFR